MSAENDTQVKAQDGRWASIGSGAWGRGWRSFGSDWLAEDFIKKLIKASAGAPAGSELSGCAALLKTVSLYKGDSLKLPRSPAEEAAYQASLAQLHKDMKKTRAKTGVPGVYRVSAPPADSEDYKKYMAIAEKRLSDRMSPLKPQRWARLPYPPELTADPGKARKFDADAARDIISACKTMAAIGRLLPKAVEQAKRRGAMFNRWETPTRKLPAWVAAIGAGEAVVFNAAEVYAQRSCFAIFLQNGEHSGFVSTRKDIKPDLGSARLFPNEAMALQFAKLNYKNFNSAVVAVDIEPKSYTPATGKRASYEELNAVIAAKEAAELDAAIKGARLQALEAELERRKTQAGESVKPAVKRARL